MNTTTKAITLPSGTKVKITISADGPITEREFPILRDEALINMGECLISFADALTGESKSAPEPTGDKS